MPAVKAYQSKHTRTLKKQYPFISFNSHTKGPRKKSYYTQIGFLPKTENNHFYDRIQTTIERIISSKFIANIEGHSAKSDFIIIIMTMIWNTFTYDLSASARHNRIT